MTCAFGVLQIMFMDSKESEEKIEEKQEASDDDGDEKKVKII